MASETIPPPTSILARAILTPPRLVGCVMRGMSQTLPLFFRPHVRGTLRHSPTRVLQREPQLHTWTEMALVVDARNAQLMGACAQSRGSRCLQVVPCAATNCPVAVRPQHRLKRSANAILTAQTKFHKSTHWCHAGRDSRLRVHPALDQQRRRKVYDRQPTKRH
jgi:hypothetical protein